MTTMHENHLMPHNPNGAFYILERDGLTQGALTRWMLCPEKARLSLLNGLSMSGRKDAIEFGNIVHENLDHTYTTFAQNVTAGRTFTVEDAIAVSKRYLKQQEIVCYGAVLSDKDAEAMQVNYAMASKILPLYFRQWGRDFTDVEWVSLEEEFFVPYSISKVWYESNFNLRGKIDGVYRTKGGSKSLWIMDTKTKSSIDEPTIPIRLSYDFQLGFYMYAAAQIYNEEPFGIMYNLIKRPQLRRKVSESVDDFATRCGDDAWMNMSSYFKRIEVIMDKSEVQRYRNEMHTVISGFTDWYYGGGGHFRNSVNCHNGMWKCEFIEVCGLGRMDYVSSREFVYPELSTG